MAKIKRCATCGDHTHPGSYCEPHTRDLSHLDRVEVSRRVSSRQSGYGLWPMVASERWPDELTCACGKCGATSITLTGSYAARGTGAGGRGRLGDPGGLSWAECNVCRARGYSVKREAE